MSRRALLALPLLLACAAAADARTEEDEQFWLSATMIGTRPSGFAYQVDVQPRFYDGAGRLGQLLFRTALGWRVAEGLNLYGGYAHVVLPTAGADDRNEDRFFGQLLYTRPRFAGGSLILRTRVEHRDLSNGREAGWRVRQWIRYARPLGDPKGVRGLAHVEGFANLNDTDWGARAGFDQLRSFVGFEVPVGGRNTFELGYLNQLVNAPGGLKRVNHIASIGVFIRP